MRKKINSSTNLPIKLVTFLRENDALQQFKANVIKQRGSLDYLEDKKESPIIIDRAFRWRDTPEGHDFWRVLHQEYSRL